MGRQDELDKLVAEKARDGLTNEEKAEIARKARKLKNVNVNLAYARHAVAFVLEKVPKVANWDEPSDHSAEGIYRTTGSVQKSEKAWDAADKCVYGKLRQEPDWQRINAQTYGVRNVGDIRTLSGLADAHGCGNCGEMTARAFMFLYDLGIRPLDFMVLIDPADHAFVVIGRDGRSDNNNQGTNWGDAAVVCDPWAFGLNKPLARGEYGPPSSYGEAYTAYPTKDLGRRMATMHASFKGVSIAVSA